MFVEIRNDTETVNQVISKWECTVWSQFEPWKEQEILLYKTMTCKAQQN